MRADLERSFGHDDLYDAFFEYKSRYKLKNVENTSDEVARFLSWLFEDRENEVGGVENGVIDTDDDIEEIEEIQEIQEIEGVEARGWGGLSSSFQAASQANVSQQYT